MDDHIHHAGDSHRLAVVAAINVAGFAAELIGGILFGSVALLADAAHMLFDAVSYVTAFAAATAAERMDGSEEWPFGFHRLEVLAAIVNGLLLIPMAGWIVWEAYQRFLAPMAIDLLPAATVATAGLAVNLLSVWYLQGAEGLNERGALYHLLSDAAGSVAVLVGLAAIRLTGSAVIDPVVAVVIAVFVVWSAARVLLEGTGIILQRSPVDPDALREAVAAIDGVADVHGVRAWQVCSRVNVCTLHAAVTVETLADADAIRRTVTDRLRDRFGMEHVTVQIEQAD